MAIQACESITLNNIDARCETSFGGIKRVLVALKDDVIGVGEGKFTKDEMFATAGGEENLENLIMKIGGTGLWVEYKFRRNTGSYSTTVSPDVAIGNSFATTDVTLQFSKAEATKRMAIQSLINAGAVLIIEDMYGQYVFLGIDREVVITNATMASGTSESDLNGFTLTLQDVSLELPYFIDESVVVDDLLKVDNIIIGNNSNLLH